MNINEYIGKMKDIENKLINFLDEEDNEEENYENFIKAIKDENIFTNQHDFKIILYLINTISNNRQPTHNFLNKISKLLKEMKEEIKKYYSNDEIFNIFKANKRILLLLIEENIFTIDQRIYNEMMKFKYKKMDYPQFFICEIKTFIENENKNNKINYYINVNDEFSVSDDEYFESSFYEAIQRLLAETDFNEFNEKRKKGENDGYLCKIIQEDLIEEFIIYVNKECYPLESYIQMSIFETNEFLLKRNRTKLIEYAAFYGSIQIFKYLSKNGVKMTPNLLIYAIHGCDEEIIHIIEEKMKLSSKIINQSLKESLKCHYNYITDYIEANLIKSENYINSNSTDDYIYQYYLKYYNFNYFDEQMLSNKNLFIYECKYDYYRIVEFLLSKKKMSYYNTMIIILKLFL